jgi:hypothetical protein
VNATAVIIIVDVASVLVSWVGAAFIAGSRWGQVRGDLDALRREKDTHATSAEVRSIAERLARIEGMFELRLRDGDKAA